jgi:hypothetical protein
VLTNNLASTYNIHYGHKILQDLDVSNVLRIYVNINTLVYRASTDYVILLRVYVLAIILGKGSPIQFNIHVIVKNKLKNTFVTLGRLGRCTYDYTLMWSLT